MCEKNIENDSSVDGEDGIRFTFVRSILLDASALENLMLEEDQRVLDAESARNECGGAVENWIVHKVPWSNIYEKIDLNLKPNENIIDDHDNLWGTNVKTLMENSIKDNAKYRKIGCMPVVNLVL